MAVGTVAFLDIYSVLLDRQCGRSSDVAAHCNLILQHDSQPRGGEDGGSDTQESEKEVELI